MTLVVFHMLLHGTPTTNSEIDVIFLISQARKSGRSFGQGPSVSSGRIESKFSV